MMQSLIHCPSFSAVNKSAIEDKARMSNYISLLLCYDIYLPIYLWLIYFSSRLQNPYKEVICNGSHFGNIPFPKCPLQKF